MKTSKEILEENTRNYLYGDLPPKLGVSPVDCSHGIPINLPCGACQEEWASATATNHLLRANRKPTNPKDAVGIKKAPLSTVSAVVMAEVGLAMLEGALKYGRHNYRGVGVRASVYYDATIRHLFSWWEGEDTDADSGMNHITKAIASLTVLRDAMIQDKVEDDRPPRCAAFYQDLNHKAALLVERYGDVQPHHYTIKDDGDA